MREHWCSSRGFLSIKKGFCKCRILFCFHFKFLYVTDKHVYRADRYGQDHHRESDLEELYVRDRISMSCTDTGQHYICRCTDQSSVSAQTCAQGQCPPERHNVHTTLTHGVDQRDHRCYEWNIVQCCRQQCGYPQNDHHRQDSLTACCVHDDVSQIVDHTCFYHTAYYDKQRGKEDDRRPFYVFYNTFHILFAYDDHDHRSGQRDDGRSVRS